MAIARLWILFHCIRCDLSSWNQIESPRTRLAFEEMFVNRLWVLMEVELGDCAGCGVHKDRNIYICIYGGGGGGRQLLRSFDSKAQAQGVVVVITVGSFVSLLLVIPPSNSAPSPSTPPPLPARFGARLEIEIWNLLIMQRRKREASSDLALAFEFSILRCECNSNAETCGRTWREGEVLHFRPPGATPPPKKSTNSWREGPIGN